MRPRNDLSLYVSLSVLSTMAIVLRLISRIKTKATLRGDDWWACLGLILLHAFLGLFIWGKLPVPVAIILVNHPRLGIKAVLENGSDVKDDEAVAASKVGLPTAHPSSSQ